MMTCAEKKLLVQKKNIKKKTAVGCRLLCQLGYQKVCLDGKWFINPSFLGKKFKFKFIRKNRLIYLVPVLTDSDIQYFKTRIAARALELSDVTTVLSYRGSIQNGRLEISQHNPLVAYQETYRFTFVYRGGAKFSGSLQLINSDGNSVRSRIATLIREDKVSKPVKKMDTLDNF